MTTIQPSEVQEIIRLLSLISDCLVALVFMSIMLLALAFVNSFPWRP